jgi:ankyrin repeat protein
VSIRVGPPPAPDGADVVQLKPIGFWRQTREEESELPHPSDLVDETWPYRERVRVATYLRNGEKIAGYLGFSFCRLECGLPWDYMGNGDFTDGEWVWPEGFAHYVEHHAVKPPKEFLEAIESRLPTMMPWWRLAAVIRAFILDQRIAAGKRAEEEDAKLPPHTTPLHEAARTGDVEAIARALETHGVGDINRIEETALHIAAMLGHVAAVKLLLERGADVNANASPGITPLCDARRADVVRVLLDAGATIEPDPVGHSSPLTQACSFDDVESVTLLLDGGANPNRGDKFRSPLEASSSLAVVQLLLDRGADAKKGTVLAYVARHCNVEMMELLIARGADVNAADHRGHTALFMASKAMKGDPIVELLLARGADPNVENDLDDTALHMACFRTSVPAVKMLIAAGASVKTKSKRGCTPLHWAALATDRRDDSAEVLTLLLEADSGPLHAKDEWGRTPLAITRTANDEEAMRVLINAGAKE